MSDATKLKLKEFRANRIKNGTPPKKRLQKASSVSMVEGIVKRHRASTKAAKVAVPLVATA